MKKIFFSAIFMAALFATGAKASNTIVFTNGIGGCGRSSTASCSVILSDGSSLTYDPVNGTAVFQNQTYSYSGNQSSGTFSGTNQQGQSFTAKINEIITTVRRSGSGKGGGGAGTFWVINDGAVTVDLGGSSITLTPPANVVAAPEQRAVLLSWRASTGGTSPIMYSILRDGSVVGTTTDTSFNDINLAPQTTHGYMVMATDSATPTQDMSISIPISAAVPALPVAGLTITNVVDNPTPIPGDTIHYTLTASAFGPADSLAVSATDMLPIGVTFSSATSTIGTYDSSTGVWTIGDMASGSTATLTITARVNAEETQGLVIYNVAGISESTTESNPDIANATARAIIAVGSGGGDNNTLTAPSNITSSSTLDTVILNWTASTGGVPPITYSINRDGTIVGTTTGTSFTDTGLVSSTAYNYVIESIDSATPTPNIVPSLAFLVTTLSPAPAPLTVPDNVVGAPDQTSVALTWDASTGGIAPITYTIMRDSAVVTTTTGTSFTDTGLTASTTYSYVIQATDSTTPTANTASSLALPITTLASTGGGGPIILTAPTNIVGTPTDNAITLSWTNSTGGTAPITYTVTRAGAIIGTTTGTSFFDDNLQPSTTYSYVIEATDSATPTPATVSSGIVPITTLASASPIVLLANGMRVQLEGNPTIYLVENGALVAQP